ncbi:unnamed protein product, partial [Mycena citricolor]
ESRRYRDSEQVADDSRRRGVEEDEVCLFVCTAVSDHNAESSICFDTCRNFSFRLWRQHPCCRKSIQISIHVSMLESLHTQSIAVLVNKTRSRGSTRKARGEDSKLKGPKFVRNECLPASEPTGIIGY